ncbi:MAG: GDP-mannose 4,6-dehydratase [Acidimicrobiia bacterium]|jgi:GDP-4-dehydro-6-deoxy-D-mannose reductase|nr:GDP-mannose 4,6-dehydratase [Acidimicrobiia bacterium]
MRALVTGSGGFVGRHLVAHLRAAGDEVHDLDCERAEGAARVDITEPDAVTGRLDEVAPDVVYHLAGWSDVGGSWQAPLEAFRANAEGTLNVLQAAAAAGVGRTIVVSSADVYGAVPDERLPVTEDHPLRPASPYAASKVAADFLGLQAFLGRGLDVVRVRAFNHIGPGQTDRFVVAAIASRIARNERDGGDEIAVGNLAARRDFTDVRDVVRAYRLLATDAVAGEVYNVCSGRDVAVSALADLLIAKAVHPMQLVIDPGRHRPVDVPVVRGDAGRLAAATGWAPAIPLEATLVDVLADWRARVAGDA